MGVSKVALKKWTLFFAKLHFLLAFVFVLLFCAAVFFSWWLKVCFFTLESGLFLLIIKFWIYWQVFSSSAQNFRTRDLNLFTTYFLWFWLHKIVPFIFSCVLSIVNWCPLHPLSSQHVFAFIISRTCENTCWDEIMRRVWTASVRDYRKRGICTFFLFVFLAGLFWVVVFASPFHPLCSFLILPLFFGFALSSQVSSFFDEIYIYLESGGCYLTSKSEKLGWFVML